MNPVPFADLRRLIAHDADGRATQAVLRWLRDASNPLALSLHESLSTQDRELARELQQSIDRAERGLIATWEAMHPGRKWMHEREVADLQGDGGRGRQE